MPPQIRFPVVGAKLTEEASYGKRWQDCTSETLV
jgi:hypothetical protein